MFLGPWLSEVMLLCWLQVARLVVDFGGEL